jgi:hypothetical protein
MVLGQTISVTREGTMSSRHLLLKKHLARIDAIATDLDLMSTEFVDTGQSREEMIEYVNAVGIALASLFELRHRIWNMEPSLIEVAEYELNVDLTSDVSLLETCDEESKQLLIERLLDYVPQEVEATVRDAPSPESKCRLIEAWWISQRRPFAPVDWLNRRLDSQHRWRRVRAALTLEKLGAPRLLDSTGDDVDPSLVMSWRTTRWRG